MKTLQNILEGILDADFDLDEESIFTLRDIGWKVIDFKYVEINYISLADKLDKKCQELVRKEARSITMNLISDYVASSFKPSKNNAGWLLNSLILCVMSCNNEEQVREFLDEITRKNIVDWNWKQTTNQIKLNVKFEKVSYLRPTVEFTLRK